MALFLIFVILKSTLIVKTADGFDHSITGSESLDYKLTIFGVLIMIIIVVIIIVNLIKINKSSSEIVPQRENIKKLGDDFITSKIKEECPNFDYTIFKKEAVKIFEDKVVPKREKWCKYERYDFDKLVITDYLIVNNQLQLTVNITYKFDIYSLGNDFGCHRLNDYDVIYIGQINKTNDGYDYTMTKKTLKFAKNFDSGKWFKYN